MDADDALRYNQYWDDVAKGVYNNPYGGKLSIADVSKNINNHYSTLFKGTEGVGNSNKFNFGNEKKFDKHFDKHVIKQGEFGNITKDDYLKLANEFIDSSGKNILSRTASNGDILKFNNKTNEFSIVTKDGVVRTYHKLNPQIHGKGTNLDYWNSPDCNY
ncbi:hypothetical protein [Clostridium sp.]|uniref:hypothetical protein n=1 Tax=Clostridium sp. TaxID=1506 RepID=UPI0029000753|nr:hypothetical protein [Clostridium sp.]MDU1937864.1 hypothetical protein [Clostridium sp.]